MKTLRYIGMALIAVIISVGFAACSDDDDDAQTASDFIGTVWVGTNPNTNYEIEVNIKTASTCLITVYRPGSTEIYDQEECAYVFSETTNSFACEYDGYTITGKINGNSMTLTDRYGTYTLKKK